MCGICGVISLAGRPLRHPDAALRMRETLVHRGPDGAGSAEFPGASLQFRRLAIVDLPRGDQPFTTSDGSVTIVCNGEIYNSAELRADPAAAAYPFRSKSDVESVLPLYLRHGSAAVPMLEGMFALAIWDAQASRLLLARDRSGEKPLFYSVVDDELVFGSEPKALLAYPSVSRELDEEAAAAYFVMGYVPAPRTMHRHIRKLPPGHTLVASARGVAIAPYWSAADFHAPPSPTSGTDRSADKLRATIKSAVRRELTGDVPLGMFISGGMDSALLLGLAAPHFVGSRLFTWTAGFGNTDYDETGRAATLARRYGTTHHIVPCDIPQLRRALDALQGTLDEPLGDPAVLPTWLLADAASADVKIILSGEGADELFGGYPTYLGHMFAARFTALPRPLRTAISRVVTAWPASPGKVTLEFLLKRFVWNAGLPPVDRHLEWFGALGPSASSRLLGARARAGLGSAMSQLRVTGASALEDRAALDGMLLLDFLTYLPDNLLTKVDRATMLRSVEARAPFLDRNVMELALATPANAKVRGFQTKAGLKAAAAGVVPREIRRRRKRGLSVPIAAWINDGLRHEVDRVLERGRLARQGWLEPDGVHALLDEHRRCAANHARMLWSLVVFQRWLERWGPDDGT